MSAALTEVPRPRGCREARTPRARERERERRRAVLMRAVSRRLGDRVELIANLLVLYRR